MAKGPLVTRVDRTKTAMIRRAFEAEASRGFTELKALLQELVVVEDAFGLKADSRNPLVGNTRWRFLTTDEAYNQFKLWLATQIGKSILHEGIFKSWLAAQTSDHWLVKYIEKGHKKGMERAFEYLKKAKGELQKKSKLMPGSKEDFLRSAFTRPVSKERVKLLASRTYTDLKNVTDDMATKIGRSLVDGMIRGDSPRVVARDMAKQVDIGRKRALVIARTETIRAHAEGQLDSFEMLGVDRLGVAVEWTVSGIGVTGKGNPTPCELCAPLAKTVFSLEEARGLLPRHPNCMCSFVPANVGEDTKGQKRTKARLEQAIERSIAAERPKRSKRTIAAQRRRSSWMGAGTKISKKRPKSIL